MAAINLLPLELLPSPNQLKALKILKKAIYWGVSLFVILAFALIGVSLYNGIALREKGRKVEDLKLRVKSQEVTEQRFILIKDRLDKVRLITAQKRIEGDLNKLSLLVTAATSDSLLSEADMAFDKTEFTFVAPTSTSLSQFMSLLRLSEIFKKITLAFFGFSPTKGYSVTLDVTGK